MADVTISQEAVEKLNAEVERGRTASRWLMVGLFVSLLVLGLMTTPWAISSHRTVSFRITSLFLFTLFFVKVIEYSLKRTISQLFKSH